MRLCRLRCCFCGVGCCCNVGFAVLRMFFSGDYAAAFVVVVRLLLMRLYCSAVAVAAPAVVVKKLLLHWRVCLCCSGGFPPASVRTSDCTTEA
jgi:hypothetical protein